MGESLELRNVTGSKVFASDLRKVTVKYNKHAIILYALEFAHCKSSDSTYVTRSHGDQNYELERHILLGREAA